MCGKRARPGSDVSEQPHPQAPPHRSSIIRGWAASRCQPEDQQHATGLLGGKVPAGADQRRGHQDARRHLAGHGAAYDGGGRYSASNAVRLRRGGIRSRLRESVLRYCAGAHVSVGGLPGHQLSCGHVVHGAALCAGGGGRSAGLCRLPGRGLLHREGHRVARLEDARQLAARAAELGHAVSGRAAGATAALGAAPHRYDPHDSDAGAAQRVHAAGRRRRLGGGTVVRRGAAAVLLSACASVVPLGLADAPVSAEWLAAVHESAVFARLGVERVLRAVRAGGRAAQPRDLVADSHLPIGVGRPRP